eukprot:344569-Lingulodinium_polyedra.AAC.1
MAFTCLAPAFGKRHGKVGGVSAVATRGRMRRRRRSQWAPPASSSRAFSVVPLPRSPPRRPRRRKPAG